MKTHVQLINKKETTQTDEKGINSDEAWISSLMRIQLDVVRPYSFRNGKLMRTWIILTGGGYIQKKYVRLTFTLGGWNSYRVRIGFHIRKKKQMNKKIELKVIGMKQWSIANGNGVSARFSLSVKLTNSWHYTNQVNETRNIRIIDILFISKYT